MKAGKCQVQDQPELHGYRETLILKKLKLILNFKKNKENFSFLAKKRIKEATAETAATISGRLAPARGQRTGRRDRGGTGDQGWYQAPVGSCSSKGSWEEREYKLNTWLSRLFRN